MNLQIKKSKDRFCSREYRMWLSSGWCFICTKSPCDPHHLINRRWADGSDALCVPLCRDCHTKLHDHKIEIPENAKVRITFLQMDFLLEHGIEYTFPFTQQMFEGYLREAGFVEKPFTKRKNRK